MKLIERIEERLRFVEQKLSSVETKVVMSLSIGGALIALLTSAIVSAVVSSYYEKISSERAVSQQQILASQAALRDALEVELSANDQKTEALKQSVAEVSSRTDNALEQGLETGIRFGFEEWTIDWAAGFEPVVLNGELFFITSETFPFAQPFNESLDLVFQVDADYTFEDVSLQNDSRLEFFALSNQLTVQVAIRANQDPQPSNLVFSYRVFAQPSPAP